MGEAERERIRRELEAIEGERAPTARLLTPVARPVRALAALPGAFDPPTLAHLALARAARDRGFDAVCFTLGKETIDKESSGLPLEDRLEILVELAAKERGLGVALQNRGLYVEQAAALRAAIPEAADLAFVVGMDKLPQIFDARYYDDLETSLARLFEKAGLLVAPRGAAERAELTGILERPAARRYASRIDWLDLDPLWRDVSSTAVRDRISRGESVEAWLPRAVEEYLGRRR